MSLRPSERKALSRRAEPATRVFSGIRSRVAVFVFITASFSLLLTSYLFSRQVLDWHRREFDSTMYNLAIDLSQEIRFDFFDDPVPPPNGLSFGKRSLPFPEALSFFQILGADGRLLYHSANLGRHRLPWDPSDWTSLLDEDVVFRTLDPAQLGIDEAAPIRLISVMLLDGKNPRGVLQMAVPVEAIEKEKEQLNDLFGFLIPALVVSLALGSYWIAGRALLPLRELIGRTRGIAPEDLSVRLPEPETGDEIAELSRTLNGLFARLQSAFDSQERFIADASHQLKTPLAVMQSEIELLSQREPSLEEIRAFLKSAHEEVWHLTKLVEGLLILARVSALPETALVQTSLRVDELLIGLLERYQNALERRGIKCRFRAEEDSDFEVRGDEDLLRSLFETLIENAVKYSPEGGMIEVIMSVVGGKVAVSICDEGKGIPEELREKVFDRFYRVETGTHGFGLGLTIARQIARAHGAEIKVVPREGRGTCIRIDLPGQRQAIRAK